MKFNEDLSVSVVVPFYNRSRFLKRLLDSVAAQTFTADKVYIIDNGSSLEETLNAWKIIQSHKLAGECVFTSSLGRGNANFARNLGYELAKTKYVAFLDSDDWWEKQHLADSLGVIKKSDKVAVYSGAIVHNDSGYKIIKSIDVNVYDNPFSLIMSSEGYIAQTSSYIIDKSKLGFKVVWDESLKRHQDFDYFASIFYRTSGWLYCPHVNVNIDWADGGTKKEIRDIYSMINFYEKWKLHIPNNEKKDYLKSMLYFTYKYNSHQKLKKFYHNEINMNQYFDDIKYQLLTNKYYIPAHIKLTEILDYLKIKHFLKKIIIH